MSEPGPDSVNGRHRNDAAAVDAGTNIRYSIKSARIKLYLILVFLQVFCVLMPQAASARTDDPWPR